MLDQDNPMRRSDRRESEVLSGKCLRACGVSAIGSRCQGRLRFVSFLFLRMDATLSAETSILKTLSFEQFEIHVIENPSRDLKDWERDHRCLIVITESDRKGEITLCSSHARELGELLEKAADYADRED